MPRSRNALQPVRKIRMQLTILETVRRMLRPPRELSPKALATYQDRRATPHKQNVCNAPFNNLYFTVKGSVGHCWLTIAELFSDQWGPDRSVHDIWFNGPLRRVREAVAAGNLHTYCKVCEHNILCGRRPLAQAYDNDYPITEYPSMIEMELSNLCNLECVMCNGDLSSLIRQNREKKKPLVSPYDESFVQQLVEFLPHLKELRFNGGEPFLHKLVYQILDEARRHNPAVMITMATNGTVLSKKVRAALEDLNMYINLSLDSLTKDIYEGIRINAKFEEVLENLHEMRQILQAKNRTMCIMVNPMRMNWHELPNYVRFCSEHKLYLWFNTIQKPKHLALWNLSRKELQHIHSELAAATFEEAPGCPFAAGAVHNYREFVDGQLLSWIESTEQLK